MCSSWKNDTRDAKILKYIFLSCLRLHAYFYNFFPCEFSLSFFFSLACIHMKNYPFANKRSISHVFLWRLALSMKTTLGNKNVGGINYWRQRGIWSMVAPLLVFVDNKLACKLYKLNVFLKGSYWWGFPRRAGTRFPCPASPDIFLAFRQNGRERKWSIFFSQ